MIIDELVLHNVGVYGGRQTIALTPPSPKRPIILIGGMNGGGKTTILDAIQHVLFGKRSAPALSHSGKYEDFLLNSINRAANPWGGAAVEIAFRIRRDGEEKTIRAHRSWRKTGSGATESLEILVDGERDDVLTEQWAERVDEMLPTEVAPLFFFDGERIEQLADLERSAAVLSTAVHSLLGLDIVDRLSTDLAVLEKRHRRRGRTKEETRTLDGLEEDKTQLERAYATATLEAASQRTAIDGAKKILKKAERAFKKAGGGLFEERKVREAERATLRRELAAVDERLRHLASDSGPLLLIRPLLSRVRDRALDERTEQSSRLLASVLSERDASVLSELKRQRAPKRVLEQLEGLLAADREKRQPVHLPGPRLGLGEDAMVRLAHHLDDGLKQTADEARSVLARRETLGEEVDQVDRALASVPDEEAIADAKSKLRAAQQEVETQTIRLDALVAEQERLGRELEQARRRLSREFERLGLDALTQEDSARIVTHAGRVRDTMAKFRTSVVERHVRRIEALVLDSFRQLLRKESLVHHLEIDPETYGITLRDAANDLVRAERLSAGERQLLAVSLLWGLARAAGRPLPFVVDTPLGRLDSSHRTSLVKRYFPNASHQTIVLSTDEEIDETYYPQIKRHVGREYLLEFDDSARTTTVREGYFFS